jgi:AmmeMemoRadiSam system protein B
MKPVREPAVAGQFYPSDPERLASMVRDALAEGEREPVIDLDRLIALVAPHAGYVYSGRVAGAAYRLLEPGTFRRVIVIAPSHRIPMPGSSIYDRGAYRTPLGLVPVDEDLAERLLRRGGGEIVVEPELHRREHSLEVQLPFLQVALGDFLLTPVVMGSQRELHIERLAGAIVAALNELPREERVLLVASTDLSHYYDDARARALDGVLLEDFERFDDAALAGHLASGACEACGGGPLVATMRAARELGGKRATIRAYGTSADANGDRREVVGYAAAVITSDESSHDSGHGATGHGAQRFGGGRA